jgi:Tol biopolymer transport system component
MRLGFSSEASAGDTSVGIDGDLGAVDAAGADRPAAPDILDARLFDTWTDAPAPTDTSAPDAPAAADTSASPFGAPVSVSALNSSSGEDDPSLTADLLEIFFNSSRPGSQGLDIWTAKRASVTSPWGPAQNVTELNSADADNTPGVAADGLTIYIASNRPGGLGGNDIYVATRATRGDTWSTPQLVVELSSSDGELAPKPTPDLRWLVMTIGTSNSVGMYIASRSVPTAPWSTPVPVTELNSAAIDGDACLDPTATVLVFASDRPGGTGQSDFWIASRSSTTAQFGTPQPINELNSTSYDEDPWLSPDLKVIYFSSSRNGKSELFMATR